MSRKTNSATADDPTVSRIVIPLDSDGAIDWDQVRPSNRSQLLETVNNDVTILEHIGIAHESDGTGEEGEDGAPLPEITNENIKTGLDIITQANALLFRMVAPMILSHPLKSVQAKRKIPLQIDADIALKAFLLTEEQHKELDPRAMRLAKKYVPAASKKYLDVWMFAAMYMKYTADNAQKAMAAQIQRDGKKMMEQVAPPSVPIDSDKKPQNGEATSMPTAFTGNEGESLEPGAVPSV
jgi:hypothetical protein